VLIFISFQATSSKVKIISAPDGKTAMCLDQTAIFVGTGNKFTVGMSCPDWELGRPVAVVIVERPILITFGFAFISLGFLLQVLSLPSPRTLSQIRAELKAAKLEEKIRTSRHRPSHE
jgi:hypothetical protein